MAAFGYSNYGWQSTSSTIYTTTSGTNWPRLTPTPSPPVEPDDEFTWLRRRVREITEAAFADG